MARSLDRRKEKGGRSERTAVLNPVSFLFNFLLSLACPFVTGRAYDLDDTRGLA